MRISSETVRHTAELARLALRDDEVEALRAELDAILEHVAELDALDTRDVEPTTHAVPIEMPLRPDVALKSPGRDAMLANAPQQEAGHFVVPRVIAE